MENVFIIIIITIIIIVLINKYNKKNIANDEIQQKTNKTIIPYETDFFNDIPIEVRKLLYISKDEPPISNAYISINIKIDPETGNFESSEKLADDPSTIFIKLIITEPVDKNNINKPSYYPSYASLDAEQRWYYLNWLKNIDSQVNIGFVFIFYYGLERQLLIENFDEAFDMILRLRNNHKNGSFLSYSLSALINSCVLKNRTDRFNNLKTTLNDEIWRNDHLLICYWNNKPLNAIEITKLISVIPKLNRRYIKQKRNLYVATMKKTLITEFGIPKFPLNKLFDISKIDKEGAPSFANHSFPPEIRDIKIPNFLNDEKFIQTVIKLHESCHEAIKIANRK